MAALSAVNADSFLFVGAAPQPDPDQAKIGSAHASGVVQCVFRDGHVSGLQSDTAIDALKGLSTIGGGEIVPELDRYYCVTAQVARKLPSDFSWMVHLTGS
jgi:hypothetical protein